VLTGLSANDDIIVNPPDSIADGEEVRVGQPQQDQARGLEQAEGQG
jgi:hypothetical protein